MSSKKDKLIDSALKFVSKGQTEKAIKEYQQVVALDPADHRQRQKLAELLVKANRKAEAISEFETIAKHYSNGFFFLKAIAVYKQIQKLDPANINTNFALASLYAKQGMTVNAQAEYNIVADHYRKEGLPKETMKVLQHMQEAEPDNPDIRLKLAETCVTAGEADRGYLEFTSLALHYRNAGDEPSFDRVAERVGTLFRERTDFLFQVAKAQVESGDTARAIPHIRKIVIEDRTNRKAWGLLADAYQKTGETGERMEALRDISDIFEEELAPVEELAKTCMESGDTAGALEILKRHESRFIRKGAMKALEGLYDSLRKQEPDSAQVNSGLRSAYEAAGEEEKAAALHAVANGADGQKEEEDAEPAARPETTSAIEPPAADENTGSPPAADESMSWEEEIDLSVLDEDSSNIYSVSAGIGEVEEPPEPEQEAAPTASFEEAEELEDESPLPDVEGFSEVELEIDDTDMEAAPWLEEPETAEQEMEWGSLPGDEENAEWVDGDLSQDEPGEIDLQEALVDVLEEAERAFEDAKPVAAPEQADEPSPSGRKRKKYDIDGQFSEFKKGVDQQLDKEDTETHYNLGIAYKEMGLLNDAISEFRIASADPSRAVACMTLEGICHRDKGDTEGADEIFSAALSLDSLSPEERMSLMYELAFLYESTGRREEAALRYAEVHAIGPRFRDVAEKVASLQEKDSNAEAELLELEVEEMDS